MRFCLIRFLHGETQRAALYRGHMACLPPSTLSVTPVMKLAPSSCRKNTFPRISTAMTGNWVLYLW